MIYLDYSATTPLSEQALEVFINVSQYVYGNTMSLHNIGTEAERLLSLCRSKLAGMLGANESGLTFTSGGSESNTLAILGLARANRHKGHHIIASPGEHASVMNTLSLLEKEGFEICYLPLDEEGRITINALNQHVKKETILAVIGHVNSELGTVQDVHSIGSCLFEQSILFHCDAVQAFGKLPIDVKKNHITSLSASSHKTYGPKGVGLCYINPSVQYEPVIPNATHEDGVRQGTVNLPGIAAFTAAAEESFSHYEDEFKRITHLKKTLIGKLEEASRIVVECKNSGFPYILGIRIKGMEGQFAMLECNRNGIAVATGTACKAGQHTPSRTLTAMGRTENESRELVRLSFGRHTTSDEIEQAADALLQIANE